MIRALYSAASGMTAQQLNVDNIANNLANANTVGYKSRRAQFQDLMYQTLVAARLVQAGQATIVPTRSPTRPRHARVVERNHFLSKGHFPPTSNPLDLVIQGNGFFSDQAGHGRTGLHARGRLSA